MKKLMFIAMMMVAMSASAQREVGTLTLQPKIGISSPIMYMDDKNVDRSLFTRFDEVHQQRGYEPEQLRLAAESAGLEWITARDADTGSAVSTMTERVMAAVRKPAVQPDNG